MSLENVELVKQYFKESNKRRKRPEVNPKEHKIEYLRRRTVRVLIEECGLSPSEAGKEYARRTLAYNIAADYTFPQENWNDARNRIVKTYEEEF